MSRPKSHLDNDVEFVLIILVGGAVYAHRQALDKAVHYLVVSILSLVASLLIYLGFRYLKRRRSRRTMNDLSLEDVDKMSGIQFEYFIADLLRKQGYTHVRLTEKYDYGIDIIATKDGVTYGIQTKRYKGLVKASAIRQVVTGLEIYNCDRAVVITNSSFSKVAIKLAMSNGCILVDRNNLKDIMHVDR